MIIALVERPVWTASTGRLRKLSQLYLAQMTATMMQLTRWTAARDTAGRPSGVVYIAPFIGAAHRYRCRRGANCSDELCLFALRWSDES